MVLPSDLWREARGPRGTAKTNTHAIERIVKEVNEHIYTLGTARYEIMQAIAPERERLRIVSTAILQYEDWWEVELCARALLTRLDQEIQDATQ